MRRVVPRGRSGSYRARTTGHHRPAHPESVLAHGNGLAIEKARLPGRASMPDASRSMISKPALSHQEDVPPHHNQKNQEPPAIRPITTNYYELLRSAAGVPARPPSTWIRQAAVGPPLVRENRMPRDQARISQRHRELGRIPAGPSRPAITGHPRPRAFRVTFIPGSHAGQSPISGRIIAIQ
jgi:hypothetical protein